MTSAQRQADWPAAGTTPSAPRAALPRLRPSIRAARPTTPACRPCFGRLRLTARCPSEPSNGLPPDVGGVYSGHNAARSSSRSLRPSLRYCPVRLQLALERTLAGNESLFESVTDRPHGRWNQAPCALVKCQTAASSLSI